MASPLVLLVAFALVFSVALAQNPNMKEGPAQVDWYYFDASRSRSAEGKMVSVPLASHRTTRHHSMPTPYDVSAALSYFEGMNTKTAPAPAPAAADGRCFHRGRNMEGRCTPVEGCYWQGDVLVWGYDANEPCGNPALVCCPHDAVIPPSPTFDPYTHEYFPNCPPPHLPQHMSPQPPKKDLFYLPPRVDSGQHRPVASHPQGSQDNGLLPPFMAPQNKPQVQMPSWPVKQPQVQMPSRPMKQPQAQMPTWPVKQPQMQMPSRPMKQPPQMTQQPPQMTQQPVKQPGLVPLIDKDTPAVPKPQNKPKRQPGDVAREKCVQYEQFAPTVRFGPDKDCVPNHTYPIGGNPALPREFPHMAQLGVGRSNSIQWFCGGSLIAPTWIMTAAHCVFSEDRQVQWVRLGDLEPDSDTDDSNPQIIAVTQVIRHPEYKVLRAYNDIALLRLARAPDMSTPHVRPACLQVDKKLKKDKLNLIGYGLTEENGDPAPVLMEVALWRNPYENCSSFFEGPVNLRMLPQGLNDDSQLCAGLAQVGKDACQGDSGGPLNTPYSPSCMMNIAGITSFGQGCGRGAPGVYTRVSHFVPWIERVVWPEEFDN